MSTRSKLPAALIRYLNDSMTENTATGASTIKRLAGRDLNQDGKVINLVICGYSRYYNYEWIEEQLEQWIKWND